MRIGLLGAFGVNNTGDNLVAIATKSALEELIKDAEVTIFAPRIGSLLDLPGEKEAGFRWQPVNLIKSDFWQEIAKYEALVIGGGGLLVPVAEFEPFIFYGKQINLRALPKTAWHALGSQWAPLADANLSGWYEKLKRATDMVDYISTRSITTRRLLERIGCPVDGINLVPDPVINLKVNNLKEIQENLRARLGISSDKPVVGVSIGPELIRQPLKDFLGELAKALNIIQNKGKQVVIFPFGLMYGDKLACRELAGLCSGSLITEEPLNALEVWALVGMLDAYLTVRYHGVIAALSQGVPALVLDCYLSNDTTGSKLRDLVWQTRLEGYYFSPIIALCGEPQVRSFAGIPSTRSISPKIVGRIEELLAPETHMFWEKVLTQQSQELTKHYHNMLKTLNLL